MKTLTKLLLCFFVSVPLFFANAANDKYFILDYSSCYSCSDSLIKSSENAPPVGTSFQNPIELGELNKKDSSSILKNYILRGESEDLNIYYSFSITDTSRFELSFFDNNKCIEYQTINFYDKEFKIVYPKEFYYNFFLDDQVLVDKTLPPGKYYAVVELCYRNELQEVLTYYGAFACQNKVKNDTTIISESVGACFKYTDTIKYKEPFYCKYGWLDDTYYYKIKLDSARILEVTTCGSLFGLVTLKIFDHLGNKINFENEIHNGLKGLNCTDNNIPYFVRHLNAGTYFIVISHWNSNGFYSEIYPNNNFSTFLNISTSGTSCPIKQKATYTKSISAGILDTNRTNFSDTKNNNPSNKHPTVYIDSKAKIIYSFQLLKPGMATISVCNSEISNPSVILKTSSYSSNKSISWYDGTINNSVYDDTLCTSYGTIRQYLVAGTYYVLSGSQDSSYGNITTEISVDFNCPTCEKEEPVILGMEEVSSSDNISLYPNPTNGKTFLNLPESVEVVYGKISDISGKTVKTFVATSSLTEINTESLIGGMYYVSFTHQNKRVIKKLVVSK